MKQLMARAMDEGGSLIFPNAEFEARINAFQTEMTKQNCAAMLLTSPADVFYTTGFLTRFWESPARPWFVVIPVNAAPIAVIPSIGEALMGQTWIDDIRCWDAPDPADDGVTLLASVLTSVAKGGVIGLPMGQETSLRMPLADYAKLVEMTGLNFINATAVVQRVREIKSEAELTKLRAVCGIAHQAFKRLPELISNSPYLDHVFRNFQSALLAEGADWVAYTAGAAGPGGYGDVIAPARHQALINGDVVMLDTGAVRDGYFCDFDRNVSIGPLDARTRKADLALYDAIDHVMVHIRPGMLACDVHALFYRFLDEAGETPGAGRFGHGLGLTLTEWPSFSARDKTVLRDGMVLTLEPSVVIAPGRMLVHEENIVLRESGAELLTQRAPREMPEVTL